MFKHVCQLLFLTLMAVSCGPDYGIIGEHETKIIVVEVPGDDADTLKGKIWVDSFDQPSSVNGVDILWVIDTSCSMVNNEPELLLGIDTMMNSLPQTGWRLNMISNDPLKVIQDQQFPLVPGDSAQDAKDMYDNINRGHLEEGFDALRTYMTGNTYAPTWMRNDAALLVVFVSDEEDQSNQTVAEFTSWYSSIRPSVFLASIVHLDPADSLCHVNPYYDTAYNSIDATNHFGGIIVDICSEDWSAGVADAAVQIKPFEWYELSYVPSNAESIRVFLDGVPNNDWHYESADNTVYFDVVPEATVHVEIAYLYLPWEPEPVARPNPFN